MRKLSQIAETVQHNGYTWKVDTRYTEDDGTPMMLIRRQISRRIWIDAAIPVNR